MSLAERQRFRASNPARWVRLPQDTLSLLKTLSGASSRREPLKLAGRVQFPDGVLCKFKLRRSSSCWSLHLALNEEFIGSIPVSGAVARSGVGFQRLTVNEFVAGSIPVGHPREHIRSQFPLGRKLDCLSSRCGFDSRCHRSKVHSKQSLVDRRKTYRLSAKDYQLFRRGRF